MTIILLNQLLFLRYCKKDFFFISSTILPIFIRLRYNFNIIKKIDKATNPVDFIEIGQELFVYKGFEF